MKISYEQECILDTLALIKADNYPWADDCPVCGRPHLFEYEDGSKVCAKCDELVVCGSRLSQV